jgi:hypothetical protein
MTQINYQVVKNLNSFVSGGYQYANEENSFKTLNIRTLKWINKTYCWDSCIKNIKF